MICAARAWEGEQGLQNLSSMGIFQNREVHTGRWIVWCKYICMTLQEIGATAYPVIVPSKQFGGTPRERIPNKHLSFSVKNA